MKYIFNLLLFFSFFIIAACEKGDPEIATIDELSALNLSETFMCQPLAYSDHLVAIINQNNLNYLCSYDIQGNKTWQRSVDEFVIPGLTLYSVNYLNISKATNNNVVLDMYVPIYNQAQNLENQIVKAVNFDASGNLLWQLSDSIHQPDTIVIDIDTIAISPLFIGAGFVHLSNGNHVLISSQIENSIDSTFLQLTTYDNNGIFINNSYLKMQGSRYIYDVFLTSSDQLLIYNSIDGVSSSYILMDLSGNIIFEVVPPFISAYENYFFHETSQGNFILSASFFDNAANFKGVVFCINGSGKLLWSNNINNPQTMIMMSVQEKADGYLFSGFNTATALLNGVDWRTTFGQNKYTAVLQKTGLDGSDMWVKPLQVMSNTSGAASIGIDQITFFSGKYENSKQSIYLIKLDALGQILN